jgi:hypothetical protein
MQKIGLIKDWNENKNKNDDHFIAIKGKCKAKK